MNETYLWLIFGGAAFLLTALNLARTLLRKSRGWQVLLYGALSCGALAVFEAYRMVSAWFVRGDMAAIYDVVPGMTGVLTIALAVGLVLNLFILLRNLKK